MSELIEYDIKRHGMGDEIKASLYYYGAMDVVRLTHQLRLRGYDILEPEVEQAAMRLVDEDEIGIVDKSSKVLKFKPKGYV